MHTADTKMKILLHFIMLEYIYRLFSGWAM